MKVKDLIEELSKCDSELDVIVVSAFTEHSGDCGSNDYGCYCMTEDHEFDLGSGCVSLEKKYDRKTKKQVPVKVAIRAHIN